jgi:hypothetical protein
MIMELFADFGRADFQLKHRANTNFQNSVGP